MPDPMTPTPQALLAERGLLGTPALRYVYPDGGIRLYYQITTVHISPDGSMETRPSR